jgi:glycerol-3-phosphate dehydrogenase (NAD+)
MATTSFYIPCTTQIHVAAETRSAHASGSFQNGDSRKPSSRVELRISGRDCVNWAGGLRTHHWAAIPVQSSSEFLHSIAEYVPATLPFLSVSKGLELSSLEMMSQVIPRALGNPRQPVAVISGPSFAIELMDELPTAIVAASRDKELARACQQLLASRYLRVNTSTDVVGVEMAGALKNVLAVAAGIVEGMELGNNCMAALVAQGCSEIRWLAEKMGAKSHTLSGLSGSGDIMLTCFVSLSRNRSVGVKYIHPYW